VTDAAARLNNAFAGRVVVTSPDRIDQLRTDYGGLEFDIAPGANDVFAVVSGSRVRTLTLLQHWPSLLTKSREATSP
jgi:hypothetical protein